VNLALAHWPDGVKLLGGGAVQGKRHDEPTRVPYLVVEFPDGLVETVFPDLVSSLSSYAFLRKREATLVLALRSRAQEWCKQEGLSSSSTAVAVPSAVRWAWGVSEREAFVRAGIQEDTTSEAWWG